MRKARWRIDCFPLSRKGIRALVVWACLFVFPVVTVAGCAMDERASTRPATDESSVPDTSSSTSVPADSIIESTGTIRYVDLEGGFYGLVDTSGTKYDPTPLPESFQKDGLRVRFRVTEKDVMTTRMWGTPVDVLHMERIEDED